MELRRVIFVSHPAERMYDLIEGAEHYPAFLPWCTRVTILERDPSVVAATLEVAWHGLRFDLTTRNRKRRPEWLEVTMSNGPFREFHGEWQLKPLGEAGCRIDFTLRYTLLAEVFARAAGPAVERVADRIVDAFVQRADALGDRIPPLAYVIAATDRAPPA